MKTVAKPARKAIGAIELLKLLRSGWRTRRELREALGWSEVTVDGWVNELLLNGMLAEREGIPVPGAPGRPAASFTLTREWGGTQPQENAR